MECSYTHICDKSKHLKFRQLIVVSYVFPNAFSTFVNIPVITKMFSDFIHQTFIKNRIAIY